MNERGDADYVGHIRESIAAIESFLQGVHEAQFYESRLVQSAVVREIEVIGEAVKRLSPEFRRAHPSMDKLIHHYFGLDLPLVWETTQRSIPELKAELDRLDR